ncbi:hypothetical protein LX15_004280 [Streptoalloteichus tenebrarius]|uniref:Uncharacterized protein n=1 Tax=Streptoalloteichus tenebrarius (strain ATCC 17920 / DSM 40477 / JCM 4838 / CBS 697.72 / NBRC 16177 / NCIMB 11028 / NRRL B-12390 / A12253. 1 / ISP 5477) TaxID=1933 RepID=A0ABT1HYF1_STRSD|nr:DUF6474 family protein [Streptoalloteichus tenebrarius]MCP2260562.1 hypothetical protein [Streptoalloteichus tenebrarius]BFF01905.1 hypothetical protein GCM10020241_35800 [Streptoalloteichus tenebrarius]
MARGKGRSPLVTPARLRRLLGLAKVVGPVVAPVALRAVAVAREGLDRARARRLGVPVESLAAFSGRGGALHARISGVAGVLAELRARHEDAETQRFADEGERRLADLAAAVRAAERMPSARRRAAHRAVAGELVNLESELLRRLGV